MIPTAHTEVTMKIHCPSKHMPVWKQFVFSLKLLGLIINWAILLKVNPFSSHWELLFLIKQFSWFAILFMSHLRLKFAHLHHCFYKALVFYSLPVSPHNYIYFSVCFDVGQLEALSAPSKLSLWNDIHDSHHTSLRVWENVLVTLLKSLRHRHQTLVLKLMPARDKTDTALLQNEKKQTKTKTKIGKHRFL